MLRADFQRIFSSLRFWAAAAGVFLAMGIAAYLQFTGELGYTLELAASGLPPGFHQEVLLAALRTPWLIQALTLAATLPFASSLAEDRRDGRGVLLATRTLWRKYLCGRCASIALSAALAAILGLLLCIGVLVLILLPMELAAQEAPASQMPAVWGMVLRAGTSCAIFALTGALGSMALRGAWAAYVLPPALWIGLHFLCIRAVPALFCLDIVQWIQPVDVWLGGSWGVLLFQGELLAILVLAIYLVGKGAFLAPVRRASHARRKEAA